MKGRIFSVILSGIGFLVPSFLAGCKEGPPQVQPKEGSVTGCELAFNGTGEAPLQKSCVQGVELGEQEIFTDGSNQEEPPTPNHFRFQYYRAKTSCMNQAGATDEMKMACLDGLDSYAALLAHSANYQTQDYNNDDALDENYYRNHHYSDLFEDTNDDRWMFYLEHRVFFPEFYPGYRRDSYYVAQAGGAAPQFALPKRYLAQAIANPGDLRQFGPKAAPVPYDENSPWGARNRPGNPNVVVSPFKPGVNAGHTWGRSTVFIYSGGSRSGGGVSRGGFGYGFSGGGSSYGG